MGDPRSQQRVLAQDFCKSVPRQRLPARATTQPRAPNTPDFPVELPQTAVVRRSSVILVVAAELSIQHFLLFAHRLVPVLLAPVGGRFQSSPEPFGYRLHVHRELALTAACANMREAEESERFGFLPLFARVSRCITPKFNQPRLLRVQG